MDNNEALKRKAKRTVIWGKAGGLVTLLIGIPTVILIGPKTIIGWILWLSLIAGMASNGLLVAYLAKRALGKLEANEMPRVSP